MRNRALTDQTGIALTLANAATDRNSGIIDLLNWSGINFKIHVHATATSAACTYKLQESDDSGMSGATDVPQCTVTIDDTVDDEVKELDYVSPTKRYVQLVCDKDASNAVQESATYTLYGPKTAQVTDVASALERIPVKAAVGIQSA